MNGRQGFCPNCRRYHSVAPDPLVQLGVSMLVAAITHRASQSPGQAAAAAAGAWVLQEIIAELTAKCPECRVALQIVSALQQT